MRHPRLLPAPALAPLAWTALASALVALAPACSDDAGNAPNVDAGTVGDGSGADGGPPGGGELPSTCTAPTGPGTDHTSVTGSEVWKAADGPHRIATSLTIPEGASVAVEACAAVQLDAAGSLLVLGTLSAKGEDGRPVTFSPREPGQRWRRIEIRGGRADLAYTTIEGGGATQGGRPTQEPMIDVRGQQDEPTQPLLSVQHVRLKGSEGVALQLREGGGFAPGSTDLGVTGGASYPVSIWGRALHTLPPGSYAGNAQDAVVIPAAGGRDDVKEDTTLRKLDVPYQVGSETGRGALQVDGPAVPVLTVEAGVTLRFVKGASLTVGTGTAATPSQGALVVKGTEAEPVVFVSAEAAPAAGDWMGLWLGGATDARTSIDHARIRHAGGRSGANGYGCPNPLTESRSLEGAILVLGGAPTKAFVTHTAFEDSAGDGVVRGWTGEPFDFLPTNTFTGVARCHQTFPNPAAGACPDPAPCPR